MICVLIIILISLAALLQPYFESKYQSKEITEFYLNKDVPFCNLFFVNKLQKHIFYNRVIISGNIHIGNMFYTNYAPLYPPHKRTPLTLNVIKIIMKYNGDVLLTLNNICTKNITQGKLSFTSKEIIIPNELCYHLDQNKTLHMKYFNQTTFSFIIAILAFIVATVTLIKNK